MHPRLFTLAALLIAAPLSAADARQPNLVFFVTDDHSALDSSVYGSPDVKTPNMDRVARAGLTFDRAFAASPTCAPSRGAMLTGLMPARNAADLHTEAQYVSAKFLGPRQFAFLVGIKQDERVQIAIARMKHISHGQLVPL